MNARQRRTLRRWEVRNSFQIDEDVYYGIDPAVPGTDKTVRVVIRFGELIATPVPLKEIQIRYDTSYQGRTP